MPRADTIANIGEFHFLSRLLPRFRRGPGTLVGPGQDCAVIRCGARRLLYTVDALVEDVHFQAHWLTPRQLGRKSFLVNASDIAAMGGRPRFCVVSVGVPPSYLARDLAALHGGIAAAARECGAAVVGGNLSRAEKLFVSIALLGEAPERIITRQSARVGDRIYVTGTLGDAALGLRLLQANRNHRHSPLLRRFREPIPRLQAGRLLVKSGIASAMIDVSDGLLQDLGHICTESGVGAEIDTDAVPVSTVYRSIQAGDRSLALHGGEDYELLCTVPERHVQRLERIQGRLGCPITCVGRIIRGRTVRATGTPVTRSGFDHFRS